MPCDHELERICLCLLTGQRRIEIEKHRNLVGVQPLNALRSNLEKAAKAWTPAQTGAIQLSFKKIMTSINRRQSLLGLGTSLGSIAFASLLLDDLRA